jgi:hypothetical protein
MRYASVAMALMALCLTTTAFAGQNPNVTLPLHAKPSTFEPCNGYLPVDCLGNRPTVNIPAPAVPIAVFLLVNNYNAIAGVQTAFDWPGWALAFGLWDCQGGQLSAVTPTNPGGATAGSITTAFNCLNGPALAVIGRMMFQPAGGGCISQVQSTFPNGCHVLGCDQSVDLIPNSQAARLGKICVGQGGVDACPPLVAVEPSTWGSIKAQYN